MLQKLLISVLLFYSISAQRIFVGGRFDGMYLSGSPVYGCAVWDDQYEYWSALVDASGQPSGLNNRSSNPLFLGDEIYCSTLSHDGSALIVGGNFTSIGGVTAKNIAKFTFASKTWSSLASSMTGIVYSLYQTSTVLYVGGDFTSINSVSAGGLATFDGSTWAALSGVTSGKVSAIGMIGSTLYVGGEKLVRVGVTGQKAFVAYDGSWSDPSGGTLCGGIVNSIASDYDSLYIGGAVNDCTVSGKSYIFSVLDTNLNTFTKKVIGGTFSSIPSFNNSQVTSISVAPDGTVFIAGSFIEFDGVTGGSRGVKWNPTSDESVSSSKVPIGAITASIYANNSNLYMGGYLLNGVKGIYKWNETWSDVLGGLSCSFCASYDSTTTQNVQVPQVFTFTLIGPSVAPPPSTPTPSPTPSPTVIQTLDTEWSTWKNIHQVNDFVGRAELYDPTTPSSNYQYTTLSSTRRKSVNFQIWTIVVAACLVGSFILAMIITGCVRAARD